MSIYICPALMDCLMFLILFAVMYGAGERHMSTAQCAWLVGLFQIAYMVFSLAAGSILTRRNARGFLFAGTTLLTVAGILSLIFKPFIPLLFSISLLGIALALFFNAFQTFMRGETPQGSLTRTVGVYTLAWSLGSALGLFSSGFFYRFGTLVLCVLTSMVGLAVLGILFFHRSSSTPQAAADDIPLDRSSVRPVNPNYVWIGWLIMFTAMFVQRPLHTFFPSLGAQSGISAFQAGIPLAINMALQGAAGFGLFRLKNLLYRKTSLWIFQGSAALLLFIIWLQPSVTICMVGISLLGIYTGFAFYAGVFYASNSGRSAFNIGINECLVGLGATAGLFAVQGWMKYSGDLNAMYLLGGIALVISTLLQVWIAGWRHKQ